MGVLGTETKHGRGASPRVVCIRKRALRREEEYGSEGRAAGLGVLHEVAEEEEEGNGMGRVGGWAGGGVPSHELVLVGY